MKLFAAGILEEMLCDGSTLGAHQNERSRLDASCPEPRRHPFFVGLIKGGGHTAQSSTTSHKWMSASSEWVVSAEAALVFVRRNIVREWADIVFILIVTGQRCSSMSVKASSSSSIWFEKLSQGCKRRYAAAAVWMGWLKIVRSVSSISVTS